MQTPFLYTRAKSRGKTILRRKDYEKMLELSPGEMLVLLQDRDPLYKKLIESYSIYFSSYQLVDFISRHAPPQEVGEFHQMLRFIKTDNLVKGVFKALWTRYLINNIRVYFIGDVEKMNFEELIPWLYDTKPLNVDAMRYYYDRSLPYRMLKKAKLPKHVIDSIIDASKEGMLGEISFILYKYYLTLLVNYPSEITNILKRIEFNSLLLKIRHLGLSEEQVMNLFKDVDGELIKELKSKRDIHEGCCLIHSEAKDFLYHYKRKVNSIDAVIAYLLIKELQAINLRIVLKYKALGLTKEEAIRRLTFIR